MRMIQVHSVCSENVQLSQIIHDRISLFEFPLFKPYRSVCGTHYEHIYNTYIFIYVLAPCDSHL